ncbi:MAG: thiamine diphosphokinase [Firmicutes bacterium]|nr:thiamine diphosphokinase [Bacillota bacterium]
MKGLIILPYTSIKKNKLLSLIEKYDYIIGVDGGCDILYQYDILPNLIIGDFDSINKDVLDFFVNKNIEIIKLASEKDVTDGEASVEEGFKRGCSELLICAPSFFLETDHILGNIFLLSKYNNTKIINENEIIRIINPGNLQINKNTGTTVSFIPLEKSLIILKGMKYNGKFEVELGDTLTLRNKIVEDNAEVSLLNGKILIIQGLKDISMI